MANLKTSPDMLEADNEFYKEASMERHLQRYQTIFPIVVQKLKEKAILV